VFYQGEKNVKYHLCCWPKPMALLLSIKFLIANDNLGCCWGLWCKTVCMITIREVMLSYRVESFWCFLNFNGNTHLFSDVVSIPKTNENFRLLYDVKGRFRLHSIRDEEAKVLCFLIFFGLLYRLHNCCFMQAQLLNCYLVLCLVCCMSLFNMRIY